MLTVCCVWVEANVPFSVDYVTRLRSMVGRNLSRPSRFVCLTDRPHLLTGVECIRIPPTDGRYGWWSKLEAFNHANGLRGRCLYLDLDTLIMANLGPIADFGASFALIPHAGTFVPKNGLATVPRFNSSVMVWDAGCKETRDLYSSWTPAVAQRLWGDQDFIAERAPYAATMPIEWFPRLSQIGSEQIPPSAKVILCKRPKNVEAAKQYAWVREVWQ